MRPLRIAASVLFLLAPRTAHAEVPEAQRLLQQVESFVQSVIEWPAPRGDDVIAPPGNVDPKMAVTPRSSGTLRVIPAPERPPQR